MKINDRVIYNTSQYALIVGLDPANDPKWALVVEETDRYVTHPEPRNVIYCELWELEEIKDEE